MKSSRLFFIIILILPTSLRPQSPTRVSLAQIYPIDTLETVLLPREQWRPYPTITEPQGFDSISTEIRQGTIKAAEEVLGQSWPVLPATVFLEYVRNGNRSNYQGLSFDRRQRLALLVMAEVYERQDRFLDEIVNGIWAICEESFWGVPAHNHGRGLPDVERPIVDLFAAETGALMAWTYYLLGPALDRVNPLVTQRIILETDQRLLTPYLEHDDWGWMGFTWREREGYSRPVNNWNPWINSNIIACALILEENPQRRVQLIAKCMDSLDNFILPYPADGGCDEGPSYWGRAAASLFDCLYLLESASEGHIAVWDRPLIRNMGSYIYKTYISGSYFINFADASAKMNINAPLVYRFGKAISDQTMMQFAAFAAQQQSLESKMISGSFGVLSRLLPALFCLDELSATEAAEPLLRDVWFSDIEVMVARSMANDDKGFFLAAKGGHNDESHNHNDVGNFIVYHDGRPVLIDAGAQTYTAKTFSSQRYELWNNQSAYHNLPTINGHMQKEGHMYKAHRVSYSADNKKAVFSLDIADAYPQEAQVEHWVRTVTLHRKKNVHVLETYELSRFEQAVEINFITPLNVDFSRAGMIKLENTDTSQSFVLNYDAAVFSPRVETITIDDGRMSGSWGDVLYRLVLTSTQSDTEGEIVYTLDAKQ